jgi:hypothetical protein
VFQKRVNDWYETHQAAFGIKEDGIGKLDHCNDHKTCRKLPLKETVETLVTSTLFSADKLELKTDCMLNKILYI